MTKAVWGARIRLAVAIILLLGSMSCGDLTRQGTSSSYLIVGELLGASGAEPTKFQSTLYSDVITVVGGEPTIFSDLAEVNFKLGMKDPGSPASPTKPTQANFITLDRYHVRYIRADGRNTEGVDVPYAFDGGMSFTLEGDITETFEIVRHIAKKEAPLAALRSNGVIIMALAEVTFYGHDQTGRAVSTKASIAVEFGNFGDPAPAESGG